MNFRPATVEDEPSFREMYFAYLSEMEQYGYDIPPTQGYVDQYWNNTFKPSIVLGEPVLVCEDEGKNVGFIAITVTDSGKVAFNRGVYVKPGFRRMGVASGLFQKAIGLCRERGIGKVFDMAGMTNEPAKNMMASLGHYPTAFCYLITP